MVANVSKAISGLSKGSSSGPPKGVALDQRDPDLEAGDVGNHSAVSPSAKRVAIDQVVRWSAGQGCGSLLKCLDNVSGSQRSRIRWIRELFMLYTGERI